jgi:hypothetical protein
LIELKKYLITNKKNWWTKTIPLTNDIDLLTLLLIVITLNISIYSEFLYQC